MNRLIVICRAFCVLTIAAVACTPTKVATPGPSAGARAISSNQKHAWVIRLEQQRMLRDPAGPATPAGGPTGLAVTPEGRVVLEAAETPDLLALARDTDVHVRRRAMLALGRAGLNDGAPVLIATLSDPDEYTRATAVFSLGLLAAKSSVPALTTALKDPSALVRGRAAEALGLIGEAAAASAIAEMASGCRQHIASLDPDDEQWPKAPEIDACRLALFATVRLKSYDALARVALDAQGQPVSRWWPVAFALQRIADPKAVPALVTLATGNGTYTRSFALRGIAAAGDRRAAPIAATLASTPSADVRLRVAAVRALAQLRSPADSAALMNLVRDRSTPPNLALEAVTALGAIGDPQAYDLLLSQWTSPWPTMRAAAIAAAAKVNPAGFILVVSSMTPDKEPTVRAALAGVFATLPPDQVRGAIEDLCDDADMRVRAPALEALATVGAPDLNARLIAALDAPDVVVRSTAARLLGEHRVPDGVQRLIAAHARGASDKDYGARAAALEALSKYGGEEAKAAIRRGLEDPDWAVRIKAVDLLRELGDAAAAPAVPAPLRVPPSTFDSATLVNPTVSPHAYIDTRHGVIEIELNVVDAPMTSLSFMERARAGFFDGLRVHRLVPNFVIQTGDPRGDGEGGPGYTLRDELSPIPYLRGTVGMALEWRETGGSQFFITLSPQPHLDAKYTVFGRVVAGFEVLDRVSQDDVIDRVRIWDGVR